MGRRRFQPNLLFLIPEEQRAPVYIRVFDPDYGGKNDDLKGPANTTTSFSLCGGRARSAALKARDPRPTNPAPTGRLLKSQTFGSKPQYDSKWYTFGPLNPLKSEMVDEFKGHVFKLVARPAIRTTSA
ncbi:hypothetical protein [Hymenobacter terricola]|uniref:hypothetical protein n=1 Tax=Hymenobacter terricola TaxID=2819236 RepID=UPI001B304270|nr:hypothetical protein [Hymenobacter terricola]